MSSARMTRRTFLGAAGAATAASALPIIPGFSGLLSQTAAADTQTNLSKMVDMRFGMFNHFSLGTFTNEEWAATNQSPALFAPPSVNCAQWADAAAAAEMSYGILTTKHHDGFALWPSAHGSQNVANSTYKHDVVQAYCDAFRAKGLKVGFYYSIWDRATGDWNHENSNANNNTGALTVTDNWTSNTRISLRDGVRGNAVTGTVVVSDGNWPHGAERVMENAGIRHK